VPPAPTNKAAPSISGTAQQGQTLTESHGEWTNNPTSLAYQWQQSAESGSDCNAISAATGQSYGPVASDVGHTIKVQETATNAGGTSGPASSGATAVVVPPAPANKAPPSISGTPREGQTLSEAHGEWTNNPTSFAYQWLQCDSLGSSCLPISGATGQSYVLVAGDRDRALRGEGTATNAGGPSGAECWAATAAAVPPARANNAAPH